MTKLRAVYTTAIQRANLLYIQARQYMDNIKIPGVQQKPAGETEHVEDIKAEAPKIEVDPNKPISWQGNVGGQWQPRNGG